MHKYRFSYRTRKSREENYPIRLEIAVDADRQFKSKRNENESTL